MPVPVWLRCGEALVRGVGLGRGVDSRDALLEWRGWDGGGESGGGNG